MVEDLMLFRMDEHAKVALGKCTIDDVNALHCTLGPVIRSMYRLWDNDNPETMLNYQAHIVGGVDINPRHPENVSKRILLAAWEFMK